MWLVDCEAHMMRRANVVFLASLLIFVGASATGAILPDNVLVLYNPSWTDGTHSGDYVADYYASQRNIPASNVIGITGLGTGEEISAADYLNVIWPQVQSALATRNISTIVTTKGLPLRIQNGMPNPAAATGEYTYTDAAGMVRTVYSDTWKPYSSLESELTRINTIGVRNGSNWLNTALLQMGDQTYMNPPSPNPAANPYYRKTTAFDHSNPTYGGMYLTSRLDGFTVADVTSSINRAQNACLIPLPNSQYIVMDDSPNSVGTDRITELKTVLDSRSYPWLYDTTAAAITTASRPVIGYVSHGTNDGPGGLSSGYIPNQLSFTLANGAVFMTHESFNAYSFVRGGNVAGQGLVAEWLAKGGTVGIGNVQEPVSGPENEANEDQVFKMLLNGKTWGEAAWSSMRQLSYVNTVVGDPLMTWKTLLPGDASMDGRVNIDDLTLLSTYWQNNNPSMAGGFWWGHGDFNGDGRINIDDLTLLATYWGQTSSWAQASGMSAPPLDVGTFLSSVPEPSTVFFALFGLAAFCFEFGWRRRHSISPARSKSSHSGKSADTSQSGA